MINVPCAGSRTFSFDARPTAFISVDMQHDFVSDNGACGAAGIDMTSVQAVIPNLQNVLSSMRSAGVAVVHTRYGFKPDLSNLPESVRQQSRDAGGEYGTPGPMGSILIEGEEGFEIIPEMMPRDDEIVIDKATFGAFTDTDLHKHLQSREITHLIIGGVTTQCCVEGTLREAVDRGYFCLTLYDGSGAFETELHEGTMRAIQSEGHLFGWIANCDDVVAAIRAAAK
jgi:nicotinamidase-related amidase